MATVRVLVLLLLAVPAAAEEPVVTGPAQVVDGDTLKIGDQAIRLFGVDAPEKGDPYGAEAKARLTELVEGREITCRPTGATSYDRIVARCFAGARDLAETLVVEGLAFSRPSYTTDYEAAEAEARAAGAGAWPTKNGYLDYVSAWGPFAGAFLGLIALLLAALFNAHLNRKHREWEMGQERKALANAFMGEIGAIREAIRRRRYIEDFTEAAHGWKVYGQGRVPADQRPDIPSFQVRENYFTIFEENADKIGLLTPPLPQNLVFHYTLLRSVKEDVRTIVDGELDEDLPRFVANFLLGISWMLQEAQVSARELLNDLAREAGLEGPVVLDDDGSVDPAPGPGHADPADAPPERAPTDPAPAG